VNYCLKSLIKKIFLNDSSGGFAMFLDRKVINLILSLFSVIYFNINPAYAKTVTRNVTVQINKPEIIFKYYIIDVRFDLDRVKCQIYRPPDMRMWKKPKFGMVKFKKGVVIDNDKLRGDQKNNCKGKIIKSTAVEFTGEKKGKVSFEVEVFYRQGRYEEQIFDTLHFNVNVR
jgi:hypothetical protein